jgi:O-antigen ligase
MDTPRPEPPSWIGVVLGLWLSGVFATSLLIRADAATYRSTGTAPLAMALVWPLAYFMMSRHPFVPRALTPGMTAGLTVFLLCCGLSSLGSPVPLESLAYTVLTLAACWIALQFNSRVDERELRQGLELYAVLMTVMLGWFASYDYVPGERLGNGRKILNPNTVGLVAMSVFLTAFFVRSSFIRGVIAVVVGAVIVLTGSRTALIGSAIGTAVVLWVRGRGARKKTIVLAVGVIAGGSLFALLYTEAFLRGLEQLLSLHDRDRGLASGATGRFEAWQATWKLFQSHPVLGVGFRAHEQFREVGASSHNGYLALLAEIGVVGFAAAFYLEAAGLRRIWNAMKDPAHVQSRTILFGFGCAYLFLAGFERYFINVGNPTSLLFLLCLLAPRRMGAQRVAPAAADSTFANSRRAPFPVGSDRDVVEPGQRVPRRYPILSLGKEAARP